MPALSSSNAAVTLAVSPDRSRAVVTLGGDLDMDARRKLNETVDHLTVAAPDRIDVDVSAVTYVGSVLPNFLAQVRKAVPAGCLLTVSHPSPSTRFVLHVTNMAQIASIEEAA